MAYKIPRPKTDGHVFTMKYTWRYWAYKQSLQRQEILLCYCYMSHWSNI